jgi:hypothetical protein
MKKECQYCHHWGILKMITKLYVTRNDDTTSFCYKSYNNIGCDDDEDEEVDSDDMEYTPPPFFFFFKYHYALN